jgi:hypothetical protein
LVINNLFLKGKKNNTFPTALATYFQGTTFKIGRYFNHDLMWTQWYITQGCKKLAGFSFFFALVVWVTGHGGGGIDGINCHKDISVNAMLSPF